MKIKSQVLENDKKIIDYLESLAEKIKDSKFGPDIYEKANEELAKVTKFLNITENQAILFTAIFAANLKRSEVDQDDIASYINCSPLRIVKLHSDLEFLVKKMLLVNNNYNRRNGRNSRDKMQALNYSISNYIFESISQDKLVRQPKKIKLDILMFLEYLNEIFDTRYDAELSENQTADKVFKSCKDNSHLQFIQKLKLFGLDKSENFYLLFLCSKVISERNDFDLEDTLSSVFKSIKKKFILKREIVDGSSNLIKYNLIKICEGDFRSDKSVMLTENCLEILLAEDKDLITKTKQKSTKLLKTLTDIAEKELFFNQEDETKIQTLYDILEPANLDKINERLAEQNLRNGVSVLLYGPPGTGKTESVMQLARKTGRELLIVEISETKSCWFGESEKLIREVFKIYKEKIDKGGLTPILLFNEADAIFSKRKDIGRSPVAQTENAIQNIILQEMETIKGILIATTNLTDNLDKAFERRFLFKLKYNQPQPEIRSKIWQSQFKELSEQEANYLAERHNLSGGQIENVIRKCSMQFILNGVRPSLDELDEYCNEENLHQRGFSIGYLS